MKSLRSMPFLLLLSTLLSFTSVAFAQSDAQKSFDQLKALAGTWEGRVTTVPPEPEISGKTMQVTLRVTSMGNAIVHEMTGGGRPDDPGRERLGERHHPDPVHVHAIDLPGLEAIDPEPGDERHHASSGERPGQAGSRPDSPSRRSSGEAVAGTGTRGANALPTPW